jgi:16S rRNA (cytosine1402-N4)-methyltransferase
MRFDQSQKRTAADIVNNLHVKELADVIYNFGEERRSRSIARSIESQRPLQSVSDLVNAIRSCTPPNHRDRTFSRVFQAIRIKVNDELDRLEYFLSNFINRLALGGRIAIISFHSLEDRLVKHNFKSLAQEGYLSILTKKPLIPSEKEMNKNRKSRSAKLRAAERTS